MNHPLLYLLIIIVCLGSMTGILIGQFYKSFTKDQYLTFVMLGMLFWTLNQANNKK